MAIWVGTCPHCSAEEMTFTTVAIDVLGDYYGNAFFTCPRCHHPVSLTFARFPAGRGGATPKVTADRLHGEWKGTVDAAGYHILNVWPRQLGSESPDAVPPAVARNFVQAEEARKRGHREAAGMAYRRVLELAFKDIAPELKGTLQKRIDRLAEDSKLTPDLAEWSHSVRELGNEATHDEPEPPEKDIDDLGAITRVVLEYLYTLPAKVRSRKPEATPAAEVINDEVLAEGEG